MKYILDHYMNKTSKHTQINMNNHEHKENPGTEYTINHGEIQEMESNVNLVGI